MEFYMNKQFHDTSTAYLIHERDSHERVWTGVAFLAHERENACTSLTWTRNLNEFNLNECHERV